MWFKEYVMNVILQPVHLLLYMALVGSASDLVVRNPIYALVAIAFLIPAEKFIKSMFGLNKASSTSDFGAFAKNALAYEGMKKLGSAFSGGSGKGAKNVKNDSIGGNEGEEAKFNKIRRAELGAYSKNTGDSGDINNDNADNPRLANSKELTEEQQKQMELDKIRQEKEQLGRELDEYEENGGDIYSSTDPEIQDKQLRYNELDKQEKEFNEQQENIDQGRMQNLQGNGANNNSGTREGYRQRLALRAAKTGVKATYKGLKMAATAVGRTFLTGGGAAIGLASALATGDASNVAKFTIGGAMAGDSIAKGVSRIPQKLSNGGKSLYQGASNAYGNIQNAINEEKYGFEEARNMKIEKGNVKARKEFLKDDKQIRKYTDIAGKIGYNGNIKDLMNAAADYKEAGVGDEMIENALKVEQKRDKTIGGENHDKMVDVASFATKNEFKKSDITSAKSRSDMEDIIQANVGQKDRYEVMKNIADLYGQGEFYSKNSRFKQQNAKVKPANNTKKEDNTKPEDNIRTVDNKK